MSSTADLTNVIRHLGVPTDGTSGDPELLDRYARGHDQTAFVALVRRYGTLVLGVARRQVADGHRAEDVFQSTFLALARSASKLRSRPVLANWLYTVALRHARKARARATRREVLELTAPPRQQQGRDPLAEITGRELVQAIDDELARLPDRLRLPVLLCCVQGLSREEAGRRLGWSGGVVKGRLERGRRKLAARLAARGLAPSMILLAPVAAAAVPPDLLARAAELAASPWSKAVPAAVSALAATEVRRSLTPLVALAGCLLAGIVTSALAGRTLVDPVANPVAGVPGPPAAAPGPAANPVPADPLPADAVLRFGTPRYRHVASIEDLAVSPDGKVAVACSGTKLYSAARAYDLSTGRVLFTLDDVRDVEEVAFSPDGKTLATRSFASEKHAIHLHDATTGKGTGRVATPGAALMFEFSPDGKRIVYADQPRNALHLLDIAKGEVVRTFQHTGTVFAVAFSPDGKHVVGGGYDSENKVYFARLWEIDTGTEARRFEFGKWGIRSLAFSADGATLAIGGDYGKPPAVKLFDTATGKERVLIPFPDASGVRSVAFSPDGKTLAASGGSTTRLFDTTTGKERVKIDRKGLGLRFSPDGATLVGAVAGTVYRWDAITGKSLIPGGGESPVAQIAVTADGKRIVTRGQDGDAHIWDARTGEHQRQVNMIWQQDFALSPDGRFLVWPAPDEALPYKVADQPNSIYTGNRLRMIDVTDGKVIERFGGFAGSAHDLFFAPDGKTLVTVGHPDATVRLWNVATGKVERSFSIAEPGARVSHARPSPDRKVLALVYQKPREGSLNSDYVRKLWDIASGKELDEQPGHWASSGVVALAPDGKTMAVATQAGTIRFEDLSTGRVQRELRGSRDGVTALAFGPDGQLFTGTPDATVLAWDPKVVKFPPAERK